MSSTNLLDPSSLLSTLPSLLPDSTSALESPQEALAAFLHTVNTTLGFRLVGIDESSPAQEYPDNKLPESWKSKGPGDYAFRYRHDQSSLVFLIKVVKMATRTLVHGIAFETDKTASMDIATADFFSPSFFPYERTSSDPLVNGFISSNRVSDLVATYKNNILQKLVPGLRKEGYDETPSSSSSAAPASAYAPPANPPLANPRPERPPSPPFNPDQDPLRLPGRGQNPLEIGRRDLDPLPLHPNPFQPYAPPNLFDPESGGMIVGPNHPMFTGGGGRSGQGQRGPWGGDGFLPPLGAPPGARFDPVGPFGPAGPFAGRGGPRGGFPRRGGAPFSGDPDNDEFMPPGSSDMYM